MVHRFLVPIAVFGLLAGCASSGAQGAAPDQRTVLVDNGTAVRTDDMPATDQQFDAPAAKVWTALSAAYASLGIEVVYRDAGAHRMGNTSFFKSGQFNGQPLSRLADCGSGPNGPRANSSRVYFSVITTLKAVDATHTRLTTDVEPVAVDMTGTTNDRVTCGSTGGMEQMLYEAVAQQLAK